MIKDYVIQDIETKLYWYGNYTNTQWTDNIRLAKTFEKHYAEQTITTDLDKGFYTIIEIYIK